LVSLAISGPGVAVFRILQSTKLIPTQETNESSAAERLLRVLSFCSTELRNYFNKPQVGLAIRVRYKNDSASSAWQWIARFCVEHQLQAVLDEFGSLVTTDLTGDDDLARLKEFLSALSNCFQIPAGQPKLREFARGKVSSVSVSRHIAQAFTDEKARSSEEDSNVELLRDQIRKAFNTPFWPFLLATTSIGQEGLDFHRYCMDVIHWNLPHTPVAFEQREGRVQRYMSKAIRETLASDYPWRDLLSEVKTLQRKNPWDLLFFKAEKHAEKKLKGLSPFWIYQGKKDVARIRRTILCHPFSKEAVQYRKMRDSVLLYRLALGQARQEDLIAAIERGFEEAGIDERKRRELIRKLWIDLGPKL
jgi:hypothetical protein